MAAALIGPRHWSRSSFLLSIFISLSASFIVDFPAEQVLDQIARKIGKDLTSLTEEATGRSKLEEQYNSQVFYLEPVHGEDLLDEAIEKLGPIFQQRVKAVEAIATKAQQLASIHRLNEDLTPKEVPFINGLAKEWDDGTIGNDSLTSRPQFPRSWRLNVNSSAVKFPATIFEGWIWHRFKPVWWEDVDTLNMLLWSNDLDDIFRENMRHDPTLHWQYFASREGILRYFPAHKWKVPVDQPDTYDARQQPWFTQSMSSAKDLLILIDVSGSIHGPSFEILKISVKRLLGTLSEYDYFNVAKFNETTTWLVPCLQSLVPATTHNKRIIYQALDQIVPYGRASWANALNFTYHQLIQFQEERQETNATSNCHQAVVLISDGGTEFPQEPLELILNDTRTMQTRIFTVAVGPHPIPTTSMRNISCLADGLHAAIMNYGSIPIKIRNYLQVLNRPLALSRDQSLTDWSLAYPDAGGLGRVVTISKPVYNLDANGSQSILGVAAVDVPTSIFDHALPDSQLGFGGYKMVLTPTGNAIVHPKLDFQKSFFDDPLMVNFEDLEPGGNWSEPLRRHLVDGQSGMQSFTAQDVVHEDHYLVQQKRTVFLKPITKSAYTLAVSVVDGSNIILPNLELQRKVPWNANLLTRAAPWNFCTYLTQNYSSQLESSIYLNQLSLRFERGGEGCDQTALGHLLWDLEMTANVSHHWDVDPRFHSRFVSTVGGITRMQRQAKNFIQNDLLDPRNSSIFLRLSQSEAKLSITPPMVGTQIEDYLIAAKIESKNQLMALIGTSVTKETLQSLWAKASQTLKLDDQLQLHWLDEGAHVMATNQIDLHIGAFIGAADADPQLMKALLTDPVPSYRQVMLVQPSTDCPVQIKIVSAASFLSTKWLHNFTKAVTGTINAIYTLLLSFVSTVAGNSAPTELELEQLRPPEVDAHLCTKKYTLYQLVATRSSTRSISCSSLCPPSNDTDYDSSVRKVMVSLIPNTRNLLVLSTPPCPCPDPEFQHGLTHVEYHMETCKLPSNRYRKNSSPCYARDPKEKSLECGCQSFRSSRTLIPSMLFTFFIVWNLR